MAFILLCLSVVTTVLVWPYKKRYALYNKLDAVMIIVVIVFITCNLETVVASDTQQINYKTGMIVAVVLAIVPLVYFTVKALQLLKHVLSQNKSLSHFMCRMRRRDYEDLSVTQTPINTLY